MKKRILSIALCLVMMVGLLPVQALASYEDGAECAYCSHYHWDDYMCDECGLCSADCSNSECFTTTHCNECGGCLMRSDFCEECRRCEDCMVSEGGHCLDCGRCFVGESKDDLCEDCSRCADCVGAICGECHLCDDCAGSEHCEECSAHLYEDPCVECGRCANCGFDICSYCGYCLDCIEEYELHCADCGECFEGETERCSDPDDATHCVNCAGLICEECGSCEYEGNVDFCVDCGLCEDCCREASLAEGCSTGDVCVESVEWRQHKCENCGEVCFCDEDPCEDCGFCEACCKKRSRAEGCSTGNVCVESAQWNEHFCRDCGDCFCGNDPCQYCGLCAACCAANAEAEGCDCGLGICVANTDAWNDHRGTYHGEGGAAVGHEHIFRAEWSMDDTSHWHDCRFCTTARSDEGLHRWNAENKCSDCGYDADAALRITAQPKDVTGKVSDPYVSSTDPYSLERNKTVFSVTAASPVPGAVLQYQWWQVRTNKANGDVEEEAMVDDPDYVSGATTSVLTTPIPYDGCSYKYEYYCVITALDGDGSELSSARTRTALLRTTHNYDVMKPIDSEQGEGAGYGIRVEFTDGPNAGLTERYHAGNRYHNQWCRGYYCGHTLLPAGTRHNFGDMTYLGYGHEKDNAESGRWWHYYIAECDDCGQQNVYWYKEQIEAFYQITILNAPEAYVVNGNDEKVTSGYSGEELVASAPYVNAEGKVFDHWEATGAALPADFAIKTDMSEGGLGSGHFTMPGCDITLKAIYSDGVPVSKVTITGAGADPVLVEDGVITVRVGTEFSVDTILSPENAAEKRVIWSLLGTAAGDPELAFGAEYQLNSDSSVTKAVAGEVTLKALKTGTIRLRVRTIESHVMGQLVSDTVFVKIVAESAHIHEYETTTVHATCTRKGYTTYTCRDASCGKTYKSNFVDPTGHNDTDGDGLCNNVDQNTGKVCGYRMHSEVTTFGKTKIDTAVLTVTKPVRGAKPVNEAVIAAGETRFYVANAQWMAPDGTALDPTAGDRFAPATKYTVRITLEAADGCGFHLKGLLGVGNTQFLINGEKAKVISGDAEQVTISYRFQPTTGDAFHNIPTGAETSGSASAAAAASPATGDPGVMLYAAMSALSLTGGAWLMGRKRRHR